MNSRVLHTIEPIFDSGSRILILGSFPSVKSRESQFYYGNPRNRFWLVLAGLFENPFRTLFLKSSAFYCGTKSQSGM